MSQPNRFNVRVYVLILKDQKVLTLYEKYQGTDLVKFPGGGLEFGESVLECLERELKEELDCSIENIEHLYTQEDFVPSKFSSNDHLLTIYYTANLKENSTPTIVDDNIQSIEWLRVEEEKIPLQLPTDLEAFNRLKKKLSI